MRVGITRTGDEVVTPFEVLSTMLMTFACGEGWFFPGDGDDSDDGDFEGDKTITAAMAVDVISTHHVPVTSDPSVDVPHEVIPLHPDAFMHHYHNTPQKSKRG